MDFDSKEEKREIQSSASLMDDNASDESFFNALVQQSPDQKINTVDASSDDLPSNESFFHALVEQSPAEKNNNKVDHCSNDIVDHSSYSKKLEIDEVWMGSIAQSHSLGILAWRRRVSVNSKSIVIIIKKVGFLMTRLGWMSYYLLIFINLVLLRLSLQIFT